MELENIRIESYKSHQEGSDCKSAYEDTDFRIVELEPVKVKGKCGQEAVEANGEEKEAKKRKCKIP